MKINSIFDVIKIYFFNRTFFIFISLYYKFTIHSLFKNELLLLITDVTQKNNRRGHREN